jgi:hypothetical protein
MVLQSDRRKGIPVTQPLYLSLPDPSPERDKVIASAGTGTCVVREKARAANTFRDIQPHTSVRDGFDRRDYDWFRPGERIPTDPKGKIAACLQAYSRNGIVRHVVDMMSDFVCQGIDLVHPQPGVQKLYQNWFQKIGGAERSERIANMVLKGGTCIVRRRTARLRPAHVERLRKGVASDPPIDYQPPPNPERRVIPWSYTVLSPLAVEAISPELAALVGPESQRYAVRIPQNVVRKINAPSTDADRQLVALLPPSVRQAVASGGRLLPLDPDEIAVLHYKKDDDQAWAEPMTFAVLDDVVNLEKLKLCDRAALDGAISHIRLWKLGNLDARLYPTDAIMNRLADMLVNNVGGGSMDLIWGPDIELVETSTDVHHFLGEEKYRPTLAAIYAGLGVPPSLTGLGADAGGFTNNFISLKTLTERLQYVRRLLITFWERECRLMQLALGLRFPAQVVFDQQTLTDEAAEKRLLIELYDRGVVSEEALQERFDLVPEIEAVRRRREDRRRESGNLPRKRGPWDADKIHEYTKLLVQQGVLAPSEVGVELDPRKPGQHSPAEIQSELAPEPPATPAGEPGQGRPPGRKDSAPRQKPKQTPRGAGPASRAALAEALAWADRNQTAIARLVRPAYLKARGKSNLRELTAEEADGLARLNLALACALPAGTEASTESLRPLVANSQLAVPPFVDDLVRRAAARHLEIEGRPLSAEAARRAEACAIALYRLEDA